MKSTIIIPTRNRLVDLANTLRKCLELGDPDLEILVYDDCSDVDPTPVIKRDFPGCSIQRSDKPVGPCELRNRMIHAASDGYIIGLDDDSYFVSKADYSRAQALLDEHPEVGLIAFKILKSGGVQFPHRPPSAEYYGAEFMACGYIARRKALLDAGGFNPVIIRAGEERDIALRLLDKGWKIMISENISIFHAYSMSARNDQLIHHYAFRNELFFYLRYFPSRIFFVYTIKCILSHSFFCLRNLWVKAYISALAEFFLMFTGQLKKRRPVSVDTVAMYLSLLKAPIPVVKNGK